MTRTNAAQAIAASRGLVLPRPVCSATGGRKYIAATIRR